ncbi:Ileal sodium/bile acid cotransporter [Mizuhopecten yessoensis]|uniref:Ileal sodium/bile acid cotransporter n=2 Tax=Mizuhopecten yessoensis TaxID=6573 RepID=A0A210PN62_MIZYE|nr:Ileal sodium/bile acid cotransporter [Mizuhopecten yessoensis]
MDYKLMVMCVCVAIGVCEEVEPEYTVPGVGIEGNDTSSTTPKGFNAFFDNPMDFFLFMDEVKTVSMSYRLVCDRVAEKVQLTFRSQDPDRFFVVSPDRVLISCENATETFVSMENTSITTTPISSLSPMADQLYELVQSDKIRLHLSAVLLGRRNLVITVRRSSPDNNSISDDGNTDQLLFPFVINRKMSKLDLAFRIIVYFFLIFITLAFGCKLDLKVVKESVKKPIAVSVGLGCQYLVMPLLGYAVAKLVASDQPSVALGIFLAGCCPGGGASNIYSHLLDGDLSLSITMTLISTITAIGFLPLWMYTLGQEFLQDGNKKLDVPFFNIFTTLLLLIIPLLVGIGVQYKLPKVKRFILKIVTPVTIVAIILLLSVGIYSNLFIFKLFNPNVILAGCLLPYFGYVIGGIIAFILRQPWVKIKTIAIETGMQNTSVAFIILLYAFPPPDGQLAAVAPAASAVMTPLPLFVITIIFVIYKKCNPEKYQKVTQKDEEAKELELEINGNITPESLEKARVSNI